MAAQQDDEVPRGPDGAGAPADGCTGTEAPLPSSAEEWQDWLPEWLTDPAEPGVPEAGGPAEVRSAEPGEAIGDGESADAGGPGPAALVPEEQVREAEVEVPGAEAAESVEDTAAVEDAPEVLEPEVAVPGGVTDVPWPGEAAADLHPVAAGTAQPPLVVRPRERPRRRLGIAVLACLFAVGGIAGAALVERSSSGPAPSAAVQASPSAVVTPPRAVPPLRRAGIGDAVSAAPTSSVPLPEVPDQPARTAPDPLPARSAAPPVTPPVTPPATVPAAEALLPAAVPTAPPGQPLAVPEQPAGPTVPGTGVIGAPLTQPDPGEIPVEEEPAPQPGPTPTPTPTTSPTTTSPPTTPSPPADDTATVPEDVPEDPTEPTGAGETEVGDGTQVPPTTQPTPTEAGQPQG